MPFRFPKFGRAAGVLLGLLVVVAVVAALFDWNWLRHPLERYLAQRSHREVRIGDLHVDVGFSLEPTVRLRAVRVENAPWADKRPAATAGEAAVTFALKSLWAGHPVISRLVLVDADISLEWQADGLRNWRLLNPEDRGPGVVTVLRLEPHRSTIRYLRRDIDFQIVAAASPAGPGANGQPPDAAHPTRIEFKGNFGGREFSGVVETGALLTLLETGEIFPLRGHAAAGKSTLDVDGTLADLFKPSAVDAKVRLAGPSLSQLHPFINAVLPASRPYEFTSHLRRASGDTSFTDLRGKIGNTDLAGDLGFDAGRPRLLVRAALRSESADLADLGSVLGAGHVPDKAADEGGSTQENAAPRTPERLFSDRSLNAERLKTFDAHLLLDAMKLGAAHFPELESLRVTADLADGILTLKPNDIGLAGGHVTGQFTVDAQNKPLSVHAKLDVKEVRLEKLLGRLAKGPRSAGALTGHIDLKGRGGSVATILASASGSMEISIAAGGISNLLDAQLGLNGGKILRLLITGDGAIGINNGTAAFDFEKGIGKSKAIVLDTDQTHTEGTGTINLQDETLDLLLTPHPKKPGLFSLNSSIRVHGLLRQPKFSLSAKTTEEREKVNEKRGR